MLFASRRADYIGEAFHLVSPIIQCRIGMFDQAIRDDVIDLVAGDEWADAGQGDRHGDHVAVNRNVRTP